MKDNKSVYDIAFTKRDAEIMRQEGYLAGIEEDIEDAIEQYIKAGGSKKLRRRGAKRVSPLISDGQDIKAL